jgi:hypothetical protein
VCGGFDSAITTAVDMPKATMNEDYLFVPDQHKVRMAGQITAMQSVTITHSMNKGTHSYFGRSVFGPNLRHIERTLLFVMNINH